MSKKKRFGISESLNQGLSDTVNAVKNNAGTVRFEVVSLARIETDPENPRELKLSKEEAFHGIQKSEPFFTEKQEELEKLKGLSETIKKKGLINPIVVYKYGEFYRLVAGERRFLAAILAGKEDIQARILNEKPKGLDLRLLQWIENTEREDLSLKDRIGNVKSILAEYLKENEKHELTASTLKDIIGISLQQASSYIPVLNAPEDLEEHIAIGNINNLDKAAFIAKIGQKDLRQSVIQSCIKGSSLKELRRLVEIEKNTAKQQENSERETHKKPGRSATRVNLGTTNNTKVIKRIVFSVLKEPEYKHIESHFVNINWEKFEQATKAFKKFLSFLEKEGV
ncbi:MAG: ParB/RepB/Spo0J family partition protein [Bacteroidetes bacterium]|nr:ParB/RepB/Spo0J family partition protein [Bacteroidota bacterium]